MFDYKHYVPILRWKAAEKGALKKLYTQNKNNITPLIELIMPAPKNSKENPQQKSPNELLQESIEIFLSGLSDISNQVLEHWGTGAVFVDVQLIDGSIRARTLENILTRGRQLSLFMIPVMSIIPVIGSESDSQTRQVAIDFSRKNKTGLCLRISASDFQEDLSIENIIENFVKNNNLQKRDIDLLIDFKIVEQETTQQVILEAINRLPNIAEWRTFTIASGSFPRDLSAFEKHNQYNIPRTDWAIWKNLNLKGNLKRKPSFADYTIQYPIYITQNTIGNPSASIRYALESDWLIMRGEGLRNPKGAGFKQYPAQAQLLATQPVFKGKEFSFGDNYIAEKAVDIETAKTGNPKTWLEAGINHHLTLVADQLAKLP